MHVTSNLLNLLALATITTCSLTCCIVLCGTIILMPLTILDLQTGQKLSNFSAMLIFYLFHSNLLAMSYISRFYEVINSCTEQYVPCKQLSVSKSCHIKCPFKIQRLIKKKTAAWLVYHMFRMQESYLSH